LSKHNAGRGSSDLSPSLPDAARRLKGEGREEEEEEEGKGEGEGGRATEGGAVVAGTAVESALSQLPPAAQHSPMAALLLFLTRDVDPDASSSVALAYAVS
jgi:hypothetical protein